jgi:hypothetical protein
LRANPLDNSRLQFVPVWAVRLKDGTEEILLEAYPAGYEPPPSVDKPEGAGGENGENGNGAPAGQGGSEIEGTPESGSSASEKAPDAVSWNSQGGIATGSGLGNDGNAQTLEPGSDDSGTELASARGNGNEAGQQGKAGTEAGEQEDADNTGANGEQPDDEGRNAQDETGLSQ